MRIFYTLTNENIDSASEATGKFLQRNNQSRENILKARLLAESALLEWQNKFPEAEFVLYLQVCMRRPMVRLVMPGVRCNPCKTEEAGEFFSILRSSLQVETVFKYINGVNIYDLRLPMAFFSTAGRIGLAMLLAMVSALVCWLLPADIVQTLEQSFFSPTIRTFLRAVSAVAVMSIFFDIIGNFSNLGALNTLTKQGGSVVIRNEMFNFFYLAAGTLVALAVFGGVDWSGRIDFISIAGFYKTILGIIPNNFIQPFLVNKSISVKFLAVMGSCVMIGLGMQMDYCKRLINQLSLLFGTVNQYISMLVPYLVYLLFLDSLLKGTFLEIFGLWKIFTVMLLLIGMMLITEMLLTSRQLGVSWQKYWQVAVRHVARVGLASASSRTTNPIIKKVLERLGVEGKYRKLATILANMTSEGGVLLTWPALIFGLHSLNGSTMPLEMLPTFILSCWLFSHSLGLVMGSGLGITTVLILQSGLPVKYVALYAAVDIFADMLQTCGCKVQMLNNILVCARKEGKV